ncbi:hypothetical protein ACFCYF_22605 [Streptomyces chartreusis]|uniref:hypothetical protein n=1 Tax=Streptomyces chartreusis TaxID=1969 RepID=UPI0035D8B38B
MARTIRRHVFHRVHVSVLAAALALPAGLTTAMAAQQTPGEGRPDAAAQTTSPAPSTPSPPSPTPTPPGPTTATPTPTPPTTTSTEPTEPTTGTTSSGDTTYTEESSDTATGEEETTEPPAEQKQAVANVTATLKERRADVPEELTSSVDSLTATLHEVADPGTTPQDRDAVTESARALASTLAVISDDSTPGKLRDQLTGVVKQVTATLEVGLEPDVPAEDRSRVFLVANSTTVVLKAFGGPEAPRTLGPPELTDIENVNRVVERSRGGGNMGHGAQSMSSAMHDFHTLRMSGEQQRALRDAITQAGREMLAASDPESSSQERDEARRELGKQIARMKDAQNKVASTQKQPEASLGKAAEVCANAIFIKVPERKISDGLEDVTPQSWESAGVKDFWKALDEGNDVLDVRAQLNNDEHTHAPFQVAKLIAGLAEVLPADDLPTTVGGEPAAHCKRTATYLEERGVSAGDWVSPDDW